MLYPPKVLSVESRDGVDRPRRNFRRGDPTVVRVRKAFLDQSRRPRRTETRDLTQRVAVAPPNNGAGRRSRRGVLSRGMFGGG